MISRPFCVMSLLATLALFITNHPPQAALFPTLSLNNGRDNFDETKENRNVNLLIDISMVSGGTKRSLHHTFSSVPEDRLFRAIMSVLTDVEFGQLEHDIRSGIDSLINNNFVLKDDGFPPESLNDPVVKKNDFQERLHDKGITDSEETAVLKKTKISTDLNHESERDRVNDEFVMKNENSFYNSSINPIIGKPAKNEFKKYHQNEAISRIEEIAKTVNSMERSQKSLRSNLHLTKKKRLKSHSTRSSAVKDDNYFMKEDESYKKNAFMTTSEIKPHRHLIECSDDEIQAEIDVKMESKSEGLIWDIYQNKSDMTLMKGYGQDGKKETCLKKNTCYVFRLHDDTVKGYKITLGGFIVNEGDTASAGKLTKFGWKSCCSTSCCASYEAQTDIIIETNDSTEALKWNLITAKDTDESQEIVVQGGAYDNPLETNNYITHTCINPMICHTLQVFVNNETVQSGNISSYNSIKVYVDGEVKARAWDILPGEDIRFCSICSTKPMLLPFIEDNASSDQRAIDIMNRLTFVSSTASLLDRASAQYKAMCWIIFDDLRQIEATSTSLIQRYILAVLYYETNGDDWTFQNWVSKPSFLSQEDECEWTWTMTFMEGFRDINEILVGVWCINGTVTNIRLPNLNLSGILPSEIMSLQKLQMLALRENELDGSIPKEIGNLKNLSYLHLDHNKISGSLPTTFYDLQSLEYLVLSRNQITGTISSLIGQLKSLNLWSIYSNQISGKIPEVIYGLENLEYLDIEDNMITGTISPRIGQLSKLNTMLANNNMLQGSIPSNIGQTAIQYLRLFSNHLTGKIPKELLQLELVELKMQNNMLEGRVPKEITDSDTLSVLDLSYNFLSGKLPSFPTNVSEVTLQNNNFKGTVPIELSGLQYLKSLQLHNNKLSGTVPSEVCELRPHLSTFTTDCDNYYTTPEVHCPCCTYCSGDFTDHERLGSCPDDELVVKMNYENYNWVSKYWTIQDSTKQIVNSAAYGYEADFTPEKSSYTSCYASTDCYEFTIDGGDDAYNAVPESYLSFAISYKDIIIYDNDDKNNQMWRGKIKFGYSSTSSGPKLNKCDNVTFENEEYTAGSWERSTYNLIRRISGPVIDSSMSKAIKWIQNDHFSTQISNINDLRQRYVLVLFFYSTGGPGWTNIGNFASSEHECQWLGITCDKTNGMIESINLINNNLDGTLPLELGELLMLKILNLSQNSALVSTIPDEFVNLWSLERLDLSHCGIEGTIPSVIGHLDSLVYLNLGHNRLNTSIPDETTNLTQLEELRLNDNRLTGTLPNFTMIKNLQVLDLANNDIHGDISKEVISFKPLVTFNVGNNLFRGTLPNDITTSINLHELDMSENQFEGSIPHGLGNLKNLKSVLLGGNRLQGGMPDDLFEMVALEELSLQDNMLMGTIPNLGNMAALRSLKLNHNDLEGTIPTNINNLKNLRIIHIHGNELTGTVGLMTDCDELWGESSARSFISDCGFPTKADSQLGCKCCTVCCNADESCQVNANAETLKEPLVLSFIIILGLMLVFLLLRFIYAKYRHLVRLPDYNYNLVEAFGDDSVYIFMLARDWKCWVIAGVTSIIQVGLFCIFLRASSMNYLRSDWEYSQRCFPDKDICINIKSLSWIGWSFFCVIIVFFLGRDFIKSLKIIYVAVKSGSFQCLYGGLAILCVTVFAIIASVYYNNAIAYTDSQVIINAVVLAIVTDFDEKAFELSCEMNESWVERKLEEVHKKVASIEAWMNDHDEGNDAEEVNEETEEIELDNFETIG